MVCLNSEKWMTSGSLGLLVSGKVEDSLEEASVPVGSVLSIYHNLESLGKRTSVEEIPGSVLPVSMSKGGCLDCSSTKPTVGGAVP